MSHGTCKIDDCGEGVYARGACHRHYHYYLRNDPDVLNPVRKPKEGCNVEGCAQPHASRGYCRRHYGNLKNNGDPLVSKHRKYKTNEESFAARTEWNGECLEWTAGRNPHGYGVMWIRGVGLRGAHRYAWTRVNGPIPEGMHLDHLCHNPPCCNPDHLRLVTVKQNLEHRKGPAANNTSGVLGVSWNKAREKWEAYFTHDGVVHKLGKFDDLEEAASVVKQARLDNYTHNDVDRRVTEPGF